MEYFYEEIHEYEDITPNANIQETEEDVDFIDAVNILTSLDAEEPTVEPVKKKARKEETGTLSERQIIHRMMGCKHCKKKLGDVEDMSIHMRIDEIFNKMRETVK